ncbi:redoxin domain-containing protein [Butyrivibrio sp. MC2013]|uniref:redoxin domain-containing protein n=1 Tax=Butyrivibrio sp. MC2013 TaxID=1280686 RepID=UPI000417D7C3
MDLSSNISLPFITVFIQGLISFFSPCVLPLIPIYLGYLSGGTASRDEDGRYHYDRKKVMVNTIFFVIGISFAFFLLGIAMTGIGRFFSGNQLLFARIGGVIIFFFGLYQLGFFGDSRLLSAEYKLPIRLDGMQMSPVTALIMGFVFSFAWTPCVGPTLSSVLILASSASRTATGFMLIGVYTLGYVIPFIAIGLFTSQLLEYLSRHRNIVKYTVKIGGALMLLIGLLMFTGTMNDISGYMTRITASNSAGMDVKDTDYDSSDESEDVQFDNDTATQSEDAIEDVDTSDAANVDRSADDDADTVAEEELIPAPDFTLTDQYGETHSLSDYKGKIVFMNFWATWCPPCREELPYIQELYEEYASLEDSDVVFLGVTFPDLGSETSVSGVTEFMDENGYSFPVLMDTEHELMAPYYITSFPTTFIIDPDGKVLGYIPGGMTKDIMEDVIAQARDISGS